MATHFMSEKRDFEMQEYQTREEVFRNILISRACQHILNERM